MTKRDDETESRDEMTKSLSDKKGFGMVDLLQSFILHTVGSGLDIERYKAIIYVRCCELFSRFQPLQYTRSINTYSR